MTLNSEQEKQILLSMHNAFNDIRNILSDIHGGRNIDLVCNIADRFYSIPNSIINDITDISLTIEQREKMIALLKKGFLDIELLLRRTDSETDIEKAKSIADGFHSLPCLVLDSSSIDKIAIIDEVSKAGMEYRDRVRDVLN